MHRDRFDYLFNYLRGARKNHPLLQSSRLYELLGRKDDLLEDIENSLQKSYQARLNQQPYRLEPASGSASPAFLLTKSHHDRIQ